MNFSVVGLRLYCWLGALLRPGPDTRPCASDRCPGNLIWPRFLS